jgi:hypothetical protein
MKNTVFKLIGLMTVGMTFSSCSMEKRLYSSGFYVQWNTGASSKAKTPKTSARKQTLVAVNGENGIFESTQIATTFGDENQNKSNTASIAISQNNSSAFFHHHIDHGSKKSSGCSNLRLKQQTSSAVPKPRAGETVEQLAQRKANKAKVYENLCWVTLIILYLSVIFGVISLILKSQARSLSPDGRDVEATPKLRLGETIEAFAQRKANKSLFYGMLSLPTSLFIVGSAFAILAIILGRDARRLAPNNAQIQKRAKAGISWGVAGIVLFILVMIFVLVIFTGDLFI